MKRLLGILLILIMSNQLIQGQVIEQAANNSQKELYDFHMLKHKKNKIAAWVLGGSGVTMAIAGLAINGAETATITLVEVFTLGYAEVEKERKGDWLIYVGSAATLTSIPFFISAGKNKKKGILSLKGEQNIVGNIKFDNSNYLAIGITIPF